MFVEKLSQKVDIVRLREYYCTMISKYPDMEWNWLSAGDVIEQWKTEALKDSSNLLTSGYAIQSNLMNLDMPCPPWNISKLPTTEYRNTKLAFGIINELQQMFPYGYRWGISVQKPRGKVGLHSDDPEDLTVWIPIYITETPITFIKDNTAYPINMEDDGSMYLLDTTYQHFTYNYSSSVERVALIFRIKKHDRHNLHTS